ncbi:MAG: EVE domain-containing protein [Candidatus Kapaibacteriales bacterium]
MRYWIIKSDPDSYSFEQMKKDGRTVWDGVRNYQARNNLKEMAPGDLCVFYMSMSDKAAVGTVRVVAEAVQDPTTDDPRWVAPEVEFSNEFGKPVPLSEFKNDVILQHSSIVKQSRLSVCPISEDEYIRILDLAK